MKLQIARVTRLWIAMTGTENLCKLVCETKKSVRLEIIQLPGHWGGLDDGGKQNGDSHDQRQQTPVSCRAHVSVIKRIW